MKVFYLSFLTNLLLTRNMLRFNSASKNTKADRYSSINIRKIYIIKKFIISTIEKIILFIFFYHFTSHTSLSSHFRRSIRGFTYEI